MGQRGALNRIPVAHNGPILAMDWSIPSSTFASRTASSQVQTSTWLAGMGTNFFDEIGSLTSGNPQIPGDREGAGLGWLATGGLDRCVKVSMLCPTALALGSQYSVRFGMSCHWAQRHICRRLQRTLYKLRFLFEGFYGE